MIRIATRYDIPRLLEIVEAYSKEYPIETLGRTHFHMPKYVEELLFSIIQGRGFILIDKHMTGALIALKQNNIWCPGVVELHELLWWVEPEHRNEMVGGKLWLEYDKIASKMLKEGTIHCAYTSVSAKGPLINYPKRGYKAVGASFVKE
jgi:hypothetical protein